MNRDQVQGSWLRVRGEVKRLWGALTDDELRRTEGKSEKLFGLIQQRFGEAKSTLRRKLNM